jgi:hypothetical protein
MSHKNPVLDRTGQRQNFKTRVAANLNFEKRCLMGFIAQAHIHQNLTWIRGHEEYLTALTSERRAQLSVIHQAAVNAREAARKAVEEIERYNTLPKTPQPKRERQKAQRRAKTDLGGLPRLDVP